MRILMVSQFYSPTVGGQERVVEDLSHELIARGHDVVVVTLQHGDLPEMSEVSGVPRVPDSEHRGAFLPGVRRPDAAARTARRRSGGDAGAAPGSSPREARHRARP